MGAIYVYADMSGVDRLCSTWTCFYPAQALHTAGYPVKLMSIVDFADKRPIDEIIIVERLLWNGCDLSRFDGMPDGPDKRALMDFADLKVLDAIEYVQSKGCKVMAVFDDHYEAYPYHREFAKSYSYWVEGKIGTNPMGFMPIEDFRRGLGMVDAVMTPSRFLQHHYGKYAKKAYYVHNRPLLQYWRVVNNDLAPRDKVAVGWSGTVQHYHTWAGNEPLLQALASMKDRIVVRGVIPNVIREVIESYGIEVDAVSPVPINEFPNVVASYDVGICPLQGEYDKGRSWIKWLECSLMGVPVVASGLAGAYSECRGGYILKEESVSSWESALFDVIDRWEVRGQLINDGIEWAWQQGWDQNLQELTSVFREVVGD